MTRDTGSILCKCGANGANSIATAVLKHQKQKQVTQAGRKAVSPHTQGAKQGCMPTLNMQRDCQKFNLVPKLLLQVFMQCSTAALHTSLVLQGIQALGRTLGCKAAAFSPAPGLRRSQDESQG